MPSFRLGLNAGQVRYSDRVRKLLLIWVALVAIYKGTSHS